MMAAAISQGEREMMRDAYRYLAKYIDPPADCAEEAAAWWDAAADELRALAGIKWQNHPLIMHVMTGIYSYLGDKAKLATERGGGGS